MEMSGEGHAGTVPEKQPKINADDGKKGRLDMVGRADSASENAWARFSRGFGE